MPYQPRPGAGPESSAYAPEFNPAEYLWAQAEQALANGAPDILADLRQRLASRSGACGARGTSLWSCIYASDLPWAH